MSHLIIGATKLEGENWLQVFSFEKYMAFESVAQIDRMGQGRCFDHIVDFGRQNQTEVLVVDVSFVYVTWSTVTQATGMYDSRQDSLLAVENPQVRRHLWSSAWASKTEARRYVQHVSSADCEA